MPSYVKISQLPYVTSSGLTNDDIFPIVNYDTLLGTTKHTKITDLKDYVLSGVTFEDVTTLGTGLTIHFSAKTIFNLPSSPATGNVSGDTTNAKLGLIQKLYHSGSTEPTFPVTWKLVGEGVYFTDEINIIYAEYVEPTWIEYWIIQQQ